MRGNWELAHDVPSGLKNKEKIVLSCDDDEFYRRAQEEIFDFGEATERLSVQEAIAKLSSSFQKKYFAMVGHVELLFEPIAATMMAVPRQEPAVGTYSISASHSSIVVLLVIYCSQHCPHSLFSSRPYSSISPD
jgi:hypothetical protein